MLPPQTLCAKIAKCGIRADYRQQFELSLRGQHSIERISVRSGKRSGLQRMPGGNGKFHETVVLHALLPLLNDPRARSRSADSFVLASCTFAIMASQV